MAAELCALLTGLVYLFFGICGLIPAFVRQPPPMQEYYKIRMLGEWGYLFGWLPVNFPHDILYILLGASGVLAAVLRFTAVAYARGMFFLTVMLTITGLLPLGIGELWGFMPLFDWNIMLHTVTAVLLYYYGFIYPLDGGGKEPLAEMEMI